MPGVEVFGQHEISELTRSREKLTLLLDRFVEHDPTLVRRKAELRLELERSRSRITDLHREIKAIEDRLASLPALEETLKRFQKAGLEERLKEKSLLVREERVFSVIAERLEPVREAHQELMALTPIDAAFVAPKALEDLPNADLLAKAEDLLTQLNGQIQVIAAELAAALKSADEDLDLLKSRWNERRQGIEATYEKLLRELQKSKIDGEEFIRLRRQIEELRPLRDKLKTLNRDLTKHEAGRRNLLSEWEDAKAAEYRIVADAARKVSRKLSDKVRVEVAMAGNREPLERLLREGVGGNLAAAFERLRDRNQLSLVDLAQKCREGRDALVKHYGLPYGGAEQNRSG